VSTRHHATQIARRLSDAGHTAWFAGGCVRDRLLGAAPKDYDIATSAPPAEVLRLFPGGNEIGAHFGVILVKAHGEQFEIATFRTDGSYRDGRRPESVTFATPEEDARRRDFSINGLFENPLTGEVIDFVGGRADLDARVLRAIGNPAERFQEDALRLMRGVRLATVLDFAIDPATRTALREYAGLLARISPERIRDEFSRILVHPHRARGLDLLVETGLIVHVVPEVLDLIGCEQPPQWHPEGDVFVHTRLMLEMLRPAPSLELCLAVLLHDIGKPTTFTVDPDGRIRFNGHDALGARLAEEILRRLRYPNDTITAVCAMVATHMQFMHVQQMRTAKLKRFMSRPTFADDLELHRVDCASSNGFTDNYEFLLEKADAFASEPLIPEPLVTGRDLIAYGLPPGPHFKGILEAIETEQLEGRLVTREEALRRLAEFVSTPPPPG
jgi:putative nucleotidyltransferase with HDIG domain